MLLKLFISVVDKFTSMTLYFSDDRVAQLNVTIGAAIHNTAIISTDSQGFQVETSTVFILGTVPIYVNDFQCKSIPNCVCLCNCHSSFVLSAVGRSEPSAASLFYTCPDLILDTFTLCTE